MSHRTESPEFQEFVAKLRKQILDSKAIALNIDPLFQFLNEAPNKLQRIPCSEDDFNLALNHLCKSGEFRLQVLGVAEVKGKKDKIVMICPVS